MPVPALERLAPDFGILVHWIREGKTTVQHFRQTNSQGNQFCRDPSATIDVLGILTA